MRSKASFALCALVWATGSAAVAQCGEYVPIEPETVEIYKVFAVRFHDPDGAGPAPGKLFAIAGDGPYANSGRVIEFDFATFTWRRLGDVIASWSLEVLQTGEVVTIGSRSNIVGVYRWDGASWSIIGRAQSRGPTPMRVCRDGRLVCGGFALIDGVPIDGLASWDGTSWSSLGGGELRSVTSIVEDQDGSLVIGGDQQGVLRQRGTIWEQVGPDLPSTVETLLVRANGELIAGGSGGAFAWDGAQWRRISASSRYVWLAAETSDGVLYTSGLGPSSRKVVERRVDGVWSTVGQDQLEYGVYSMAALPDGGMAFGGLFYRMFEPGVNHIAMLRDGVCSRLNSELVGSPNAVLGLGDGSFIAAGRFRDARGVMLRNIGHWTGDSVKAMGAGFDNDVFTVVQHPDGRVLAGGLFTASGDRPMRGIAAWDGERWNAMGENLGGFASAIAVDEFGQIFAGTRQNFTSPPLPAAVKRWDGSAWVQIGGDFNGNIGSIAMLRGGEMLACGMFDRCGEEAIPGFARWDGTSWSARGIGPEAIRINQFVSIEGGGVVAVGEFASAGTRGEVAFWRDGRWDLLPTTGADVSELCVLPGSDLIAGCVERNVYARKFIARWDGERWTEIEGLSGTVSLDAIAGLADGGFVVGGFFERVGRHYARNLAVWRPDAVPTITRQPEGAWICAAEATMVSLEAISGPGTRTAWEIESPEASGQFVELTPDFREHETGLRLATTASDNSLEVRLHALGSHRSAIRIRGIVGDDCQRVESEVATLTACLLDRDCDGFVDWGDYGAFVGSFESGEAAADYNDDGFVDVFDYLAFVDGFETGCP